MMIAKAPVRALISDLGEDCGLAATAAGTLLSHPGHQLEESDFRSAGIPSTSNGRLLKVLHRFRALGWCHQFENRWQVHSSMPPELPALMAGASTMRESVGPKIIVEPIITMPNATALLANSLRQTGTSYVEFVQTQELFQRMASSAETSVTVMTPFFNPRGMDWVIDLMSMTTAPRKELILRVDDPEKLPSQVHRTKLRALGVIILNYWLRHSEFHYETFHAKLFMADEKRAYVGSANFLSYSHPSLEIGMLVEGRPIQPLVALVAAIRSIAKPLDGSNDENDLS